MTAGILTNALTQIVHARAAGRKAPSFASIGASFDPPINQDLMRSWLAPAGELRKPQDSVKRLPGYEQSSAALRDILAQQQRLPPLLPPVALKLTSPSGGGPSWQPIAADLKECLDKKILSVEEWWASLGHEGGEAASVPVPASTSVTRPREPGPEAAESIPLPPWGKRARRSVPLQYPAEPFDSAASSSSRRSSPEPDWSAAPLADPGPMWDDLVQVMPGRTAHRQATGSRAPGGWEAEAEGIDADFLDFLDAVLNPPDPPDLHAPAAAPTAVPPSPAPP